MSEERPTSDTARGDTADEAPYEKPVSDADAWA